jgi:hypothetical protein
MTKNTWLFLRTLTAVQNDNDEEHWTASYLLALIFFTMKLVVFKISPM